MFDKIIILTILENKNDQNGQNMCKQTGLLVMSYEWLACELLTNMTRLNVPEYKVQLLSENSQRTQKIKNN